MLNDYQYIWRLKSLNKYILNLKTLNDRFLKDNYIPKDEYKIINNNLYVLCENKYTKVIRSIIRKRFSYKYITNYKLNDDFYIFVFDTDIDFYVDSMVKDIQEKCFEIFG